MKSDTIRIGLSPCPNDTFICDALLHGKIDTEGLTFEAVFADVEALNQMAMKQELPLTKVSFHAFLFLAEHYRLLDAGCALGRGCGPLLISGQKRDLTEISQLKIAIPGQYTTAHLLFTLAFPDAVNKEPFLFSEIENAVLSGRADAGLLIHESRFTYREKGLVALMDLGDFWEGLTGLPVPLGGFVIDRNFEDEMQSKISRIIRRSLDFAMENPATSLPFIREHASELEEEVISAHISLYVNDFSLGLGDEGRQAIFSLFSEAHDAGLPVWQSSDFFAHS
jgi:1,4-dihydroxy-6-naphthoate synthase